LLLPSFGLLDLQGLFSKSLLVFFGPVILPKAIAYYRSVSAGPKVQGKQIRPTPTSIRYALTGLFAIAIIWLISTLPAFAPENIFDITQSRLQIPNDVLFTRLNALRPQGLTEKDHLLRQKLASLESRLLFLQYGPDALADCPFCTSEDPKTYLYYTIPSVLAPHLLNLCVLAIVTSGPIVGTDGAVWRKRATIGAAILVAIDLWKLSSYDYQVNAKATRLQDIDFFFRTARVFRGVGLAILDAVIGVFVFLSSTNRAFVTPYSAPEKIEGALRMLDMTRSKLNAAGVIRNTVIRDESLRHRSDGYWVREGRVMREAMEDREVLESMNNALENRINIDRITADAETYAGKIVGGVHDPGAVQ